jgi:transcriptional regulator CtsR
MDNNKKKVLIIMAEHSSQFCQIAVNMGFVTERQLNEAYVEQIEDDVSNKPHRFIGDILFENRLMAKKEICIVLKELLKEDSLG